ncbi:MAG: DNA polymerase IV [Candidatus Fermentibacteraceae bacterium]|nr:DNA polymerase IV [Candidatus Fermentibacteraceae bacterium]
MRVIFHVDMDTYFVSVERLSFPWLRDRPVIVGGRTLRSVVASCSYEARELGVRSGMPMVNAMRLAPDAAVISGSHGSYTSYTRRILEILLTYSPVVDPASIDEAFMDVTGVIGGRQPLELASRIQRDILDTTGLWGSIGMAGNRFLAKMASGRAKPRGIAYLGPEDIVDFPVGRIWGVGPATQRRFLSLGIERISDLRRFSRHQLRALLGKHGDSLYLLCRGIDDSPVISGDLSPDPLSISNEHTFSTDVVEPEEYLPVLAMMSQKVARRARDRGLAGSTVMLKYRLSSMQRRSRARSLPYHTDSARTIYTAARDLARTAVSSRIRLIGVCLSALTDQSGRQLEIFGGRSGKIDSAIDLIRHRYGERSVTSGRTLTHVRSAAV